MYGLWYIFFGFLGIAVVGLILLVVSSKLKNYFWDKYSEFSHMWLRTHGKKERESAVERRKYERKYDIWEGVFDVCGGIAIVAGVISLILLLVSIFTPIVARREAATFEYHKEFIEEAIENGKELENIAITQTIIEQNKWLADAKAGLETFGCFSKYWGQGIEDLEPIKVEREQEADQ